MESRNGLLEAVRLLAEVDQAEQAAQPVWVFPLKLIGIVILSALSAVFSGLNLGLMCVNASQLKQLITAGTKADANKETMQQGRWAKRILPLRQQGNTLLCVLLLGNVMVNAYLAILMSDFGDGAIAVISSTLIIVTFGEILPQSLCYKHGLRIGATLVPLLLVFWYLLWPVAKPVALVLDRAFGEEMGEVLDKQQMKALLTYQRKTAPDLLTEQEVRILHGSLDFASVTPSSIMVPLSECFCLDAQAMINPGLLAAVAGAGYSRVPVVDWDNVSPKRQLAVIG